MQNIISYVDKEVTSLKQPEKDFRSTNNKKMTSILYVLMPKNFIETYFIMILIVVTKAIELGGDVNENGR